MDSVPTGLSDGTEYVPHWVKKTPSHVAPKANIASLRAQRGSKRAKSLDTAQAHHAAMMKHNRAADLHSKVIEYHYHGYADDEFSKDHLNSHKRAFERHVAHATRHYHAWKKAGGMNEAKKDGPKHYVLDVEVHSHPTGKLKRKFKAGEHESEEHAHKAAHDFYKNKGIKVKSVKTRRAYRPMSPEAKMKARERHWHKTGVSKSTTSWMKSQGYL